MLISISSFLVQLIHIFKNIFFPKVTFPFWHLYEAKKWSAWFSVGGGLCYENSWNLMENTYYMLSWGRISDVIKKMKIVINAIVTPVIYIDWCIKTSSQLNNELYTCQFFLSCFYSNSSTVQGNFITTEHILLPSNLSTCAVQNRGEWRNEWVINSLLQKK